MSKTALVSCFDDHAAEFAAMTPGAALYRLRKKFGHGLGTAYYRDWVRPRIASTKPITQTSSGDCEIHVLTSSRDWLNLLWALKTFYFYSARQYLICVHDDGSLPATAASTLKQHFPGARFISKNEADATVVPTLQQYPRCLKLRLGNILSMKLFDFVHYLRGDRMLLLDSDILFFSEPAELLRRIEDPHYGLNTVNADVSSAYTADPAEVHRRFGFRLEPCFNSGLGLIHRKSLSLDWIEEFLSLSGILDHAWRIEQTLFALCSYRSGAELLPDEYRVRFDGRIDGSCKHFVGPIRHYMYSRGMRNLVRSGFLKSMTA